MRDKIALIARRITFSSNIVLGIVNSSKLYSIVLSLDVTTRRIVDSSNSASTYQVMEVLSDFDDTRIWSPFK
ncbi:uncharacterized protein PHALS_07400 [Plasmopara halstedii]|uniref:Uncharacterized protein n=1 Tax=Plasmopara halstedii TaxID=4781 RepID=A0A0P1B4F0_PLAHL|nr:uncharacterized protein PHALS_07400 [Plasmopara halstedii]CEG49647.1 hypothetical protein PHALS_07400 [Plasmopara halstedii]|eukprot:XP_024586016.1 hypothetical protein PHALS_07400 [Plasmopara halstedii]